MKNFFLFIFVLFLLIVLGIVGFIAYDYLEKKNSLQFDLIEIPNATSTAVASSSEEFATSTVDVSSWKNYSNEKLGYSLKYPSNLIVNSDESSFILVFPKKDYFRWPLQDDVKITITASTSCVGMNVLSEYGNISTSTLVINSQTFNRTEGSDAGAGNIYRRIAYDTIHNDDICYSLVYDIHGANGAGLYVDDPVLIKRYDEQHTEDLQSVMNIANFVLNSFNFK